MSFSGEMKEEIARLIPKRGRRGPGRTEWRSSASAEESPRQEERRGSFHGNRECRAGKDVCQINKRAFDLQVQLEDPAAWNRKNYNQYFYSAVRTAGGHAVFGRTAERQKLQQALQAICMWECPG